VKGEWLDWMILWVFSNLRDSMILHCEKEHKAAFFFPYHLQLATRCRLRLGCSFQAVSKSVPPRSLGSFPCKYWVSTGFGISDPDTNEKP